jgi:acetoin utilization protein AcuB
MTSRPTVVREVMTADPMTIGPDATVGEAYGTMKNLGFRHLPVVQADKLVGIISTTDVGRLGAAVPELMAKKVSEAMTPNPRTISGDERIEAAAAQMALHKMNCLLVMGDGRLTGIVTTYDLLDALARQFRQEA